MAFTSCYGSTRDFANDGKREMTIEEFKQWLKTFDENNDKQISQEELREAVRYTGGWFSGRKSKLGIKSADNNGNGLVDDSEISKLLDFAKKYLGVKIVA